jgi:hypothetical protein
MRTKPGQQCTAKNKGKCQDKKGDQRRLDFIDVFHFLRFRVSAIS